jgi:uncharacterized protein YegP (UPF0339 family)
VNPEGEAVAGKFEVYPDNSEFRFRQGRNTETIATVEAYSTKAAAVQAAVRCKRNAQDATIVETES